MTQNNEPGKTCAILANESLLRFVSQQQSAEFRTKENLRTAIFHEKACFVKANVVAITLERLICPVATLPFALSSSPSSATRCMMGSVFSGRRCNLKTGLPPREGPRQLAQSPEPDVGRAAAAAAAAAAS